MKKLTKINAVLTVLVASATIIFLTKSLLKYYEPIKNIIFSVPPTKILLAALFFLSYLYLRAISWQFLAGYLGQSLSRLNSLTIWFFSEAVRYIPGNVWSFASRAYLARKKEVSKNASFLILPAEIIIVIATTTILSSYAILRILDRHINITFYFLTIISLLSTLALLILHKIVAKLLRKLLAQNLILKSLPSALIFQFLSWSLYSGGYMILVSNLTKVSDIWLLFSSTLLAWLIGYLTIVSPMGLGVRESAFVLLTSPQIGTAEALVVAVLARVILIITELINLAFWVILQKKNLSF